MLKRLPWVWIALYATLALFGLSSAIPLRSMWGINHLAFLRGGWWIVYWATIAIVTLLALQREPTPRLDRALDAIADWLFERGIWPRVMVIASFAAVFIVFRTSVQLLGDGYTWLAIFGSGGQYISKWAEQGGIWLLRLIQMSLGGYTQATASLGFQAISICSGVAYVALSFSLLRELTESPRARLLGLILLWESGIMLMFFGYAEFYPPVWPLALAFALAVLRAIDSVRWLVLAIALLATGSLMHIQMIVLSPALVFLTAHYTLAGNLRKTVTLSVAILAIIEAAGLWIVLRKSETAIMLLPLFAGRPIAPNYSVFSLIHLHDLFNLTMIVCPVAAALVPSLRWSSLRRPGVRESVLLFLSAGTLTFALWYGAAITMARDWDVMAFGLIGPIFVIILMLDRSTRSNSARFVSSLGTVAIVISGLYVIACTTTTPAEERFFSLLNERTRSGWVVLSNYYNLKGDASKAKEVTRAMADQFPDYKLLAEAYARLDRKDVEGAHEIARRLFAKDSTQPDFLQILANTYGKTGRSDSARHFYGKAIAYNPYNNVVYNEYGQLLISVGDHDSALVILTKANSLPPARSFIREGLALAYVNLNRFPEALSVADTLISEDPNSPGGHLIAMVIDIRRNDLVSARKHYEAYLTSGQSRSDYQGIKRYYEYLLK
jgi:Tfp pilus assembly protein PilF